jgi:hypothetical protein
MAGRARQAREGVDVGVVLVGWRMWQRKMKAAWLVERMEDEKEVNPKVGCLGVRRGGGKMETGGQE